MKLRELNSALTSKVGRQLLQGKKHAPTLLFAGGVVGMVSATVLACKATLKLEDILEQAELDTKMSDTLIHKDYSELDRKQDKTKIKARTVGRIVRLYTPAVVVGVVSVGALTGSHITLSRRNAALMAAYSALDQGFRQYRARVAEEYGEDKERELRYGLIKKTDGEETPGGLKTSETYIFNPVTGASIYARFFDEASTAWVRAPEYNQVFIRCQESYANHLLQSRGHLFLNEVYDNLGLSRTPAGQVVGWVISDDGDNYVDFGIFNSDREGAKRFVSGEEKSVLLDFNVDGVVYDKI